MDYKEEFKEALEEIEEEIKLGNTQKLCYNNNVQGGTMNKYIEKYVIKNLEAIGIEYADEINEYIWLDCNDYGEDNWITENEFNYKHENELIEYTLDWIENNLKQVKI